MRTPKQVLRPERLRLVPEQFSWVDQALVQWGLIDRLDARAAALYLFLVTVLGRQDHRQRLCAQNPTMCASGVPQAGFRTG
jgi:hypothetical protein